MASGWLKEERVPRRPSGGCPRTAWGADAGKGPRRAEPDFGGKVVLGKGFQNPLVASVDCPGAPAPCFGCCRAEARHRICPCVYGVPAPGGWGASINSECHGLEGGQDHAVGAEAAAFPLPAGRRVRSGAGRGALGGRTGATWRATQVTTIRPTKASRGGGKLRRKPQLFGRRSQIGIAGGFGRRCEGRRRGK